MLEMCGVYVLCCGQVFEGKCVLFLIDYFDCVVYDIVVVVLFYIVYVFIVFFGCFLLG